MENIEKLIIGLTAKMDSVERMMSELMGTVANLDQRVKLILFGISKGYDPEAHVPKGESDTRLCESCGRRQKITEMMKQSKTVGEELIILTVCKKCFYNR